MSTRITMSHIAQQLNDFIRSSLWDADSRSQEQLLLSLMREGHQTIFQI